MDDPESHVVSSFLSKVYHDNKNTGKGYNNLHMRSFASSVMKLGI